MTTYGLEAALFISKIYLRPGWLSLEKLEDIPRELQRALNEVDDQINRLYEAARIRPAADNLTRE